MNLIIPTPRQPKEEEIQYPIMGDERIEMWSYKYCIDVLKLSREAILENWENNIPKDWKKDNVGKRYYDKHGFLCGMVDGHIANTKTIKANGKEKIVMGDLLEMSYFDAQDITYEQLLKSKELTYSKNATDALAVSTNVSYKVLIPFYPPIVWKELRSVTHSDNISSFGQAMFERERWEQSLKTAFLPKKLILEILKQEGLPAPEEKQASQSVQIDKSHSLEYVFNQYEIAIQEYKRTVNTGKADILPTVIRNYMHHIDSEIAIKLDIPHKTENVNKTRNTITERHLYRDYQAAPEKIAELRTKFPNLPPFPSKL